MSNEIDFEADIINEIQKNIKNTDAKISINKRWDEQLLDYLTLLKKLIHPKKRRVLYSPELSRRLTNHPKKNEILHLEQLIKSGENINCFQSKRLFQANFHDHLAYDWNIYHLHLSTQIDLKTGFVKQVPQLLFLYISNDQALFLETDNHSPGAFADVKWLEILDDSFPEILEPYRDTHIGDLNPKLNAVDRQMLWDKGYSIPFTEIRGKVYYNPGLGRSTSGHNTLVIQKVGNIQSWLWQVQNQFRKNFDKICIFLKVDPQSVHFRLKIERNGLVITESQYGEIVLAFNNIVDESVLK